MIWKFNDAQTASVSFPLVLTGVDEDFSAVLENDGASAVDNVALFSPFVDYPGVVTAKLSTESTYRRIGNFFDTECFIGTIDAESEVTIDFKINFPSTTPDGLITLPIFAGYGEGFSPPGDQWADPEDDVWSDPEDEVWE